MRELRLMAARKYSNERRARRKKQFNGGLMDNLPDESQSSLNDRDNDDDDDGQDDSRWSGGETDYMAEYLDEALDQGENDQLMNDIVKEEKRDERTQARRENKKEKEKQKTLRQKEEKKQKTAERQKKKQEKRLKEKKILTENRGNSAKKATMTKKLVLNDGTQITNINYFLTKNPVEISGKPTTYVPRRKMREASFLICYFCFSPLTEDKVSVESIKKRVESCGPKIITSEAVPRNVCSMCSSQVLNAIETFEMIKNTQKFWISALQKIDLNPLPSANITQTDVNESLIFDGNESKNVLQTTVEDESKIDPENGNLLPSKKSDGAIDTSEFPFMCRICFEGCADIPAVMLHALVVHKMVSKALVACQIVAHRTPKPESGTNHYCVKCWEEFPGALDLENHKEKCTVPLQDQPFTIGWPKPFECEKCGKRYAKKIILQNHLDTVCFKKQEVIERIKRPCPKCGKIFANCQALKWHQQMVHSENRRVYICAKCGKEYLVEKSLNFHQLKCDPSEPKKPIGSKKITCTACFKTYFDKYQLQSHMNRVHQSRVTYNCRFCGRPFYHLKAQQAHELRVHAKTRSVACKMCGREFFREYDLKQHSMVHHNVDPTGPEYKEYILRRIETDEKEKQMKRALEKFHCDLCGKGFPCK